MKIGKLLLIMLIVGAPQLNAQLSKPLRIIMIGAHPDDCDIKGGGTAILFASMGHEVKFLSVTNGDAGHHEMGGGTLAKRRFDEAQEAGRRFGVTYDVLNNHDGELTPKLEIRFQIIEKIREWNADIVIAPRPNDYHPDHRYTGILVQDAAFMVTVPNIVPHSKALEKNPVFFYFQDRFEKPNPFNPEIAIDISAVFEQKIHAMAAHESQFFEWLPYIEGYSSDVPENPEDREIWLRGFRKTPISDAIRTSLEKWYGTNHAKKVEFAEAFEVCEYGMQPSDEQIRQLFPMLGR
jgi:LmbE family N-acetylglucosaminyl deacetylase